MTGMDVCTYCSFLKRVSKMNMRKKVGILHCRKVTDICAGAKCMNAFSDKTDFFARYADEEIVLGAYFSCNGCKTDNPLEPDKDDGMLEKLERLVKEEIKTVHVGICRNSGEIKGKECYRITCIIDSIEQKGIEVIRGTHHE